MRIIKMNGSEGTLKNSQEKVINNQIIDPNFKKEQEFFETILNSYWGKREGSFDEMKEEVMDLARDDAGLTMGGMTPFDFIDEEVSEEDIEDYVNENYEEIKERLIDYVKENQW